MEEIANNPIKKMIFDLCCILAIGFFLFLYFDTKAHNLEKKIDSKADTLTINKSMYIIIDKLNEISEKQDKINDNNAGSKRVSGRH